MIRCKPLILIILAGAGCASHPGPIVDTQGVDPAAYARDLADCEGFAAAVRPGRAAAKGAVAGAAVGAAVGSIGGEADRGAGYGAIAGATRSGIRDKRTQETVVRRCLRGRGYRVLN